MSFDFPASPADGTIYAPPTGPQYQFSGGAWRVASGNVPIATAFLQQQVITVSGAITLHSQTTAFLVEVQGGGGGGAACFGTASGQGSVGTGGGGGGYCSKWIVRPTGTYSPTCTVAATVAYSQPGNNSTFSDGTVTLTANGGASGTAGAAATIIAYAGGAGGTATGGDVNIKGDNGFEGKVTSFSTSVQAISGRGASSRFGSGGPAVLVTSGTAGQAVGQAGVGYGVGGGGAWAVGSGGSSSAGGAGSPGLVVITEYR